MNRTDAGGTIAHLRLRETRNTGVHQSWCNQFLFQPGTPRDIRRRRNCAGVVPVNRRNVAVMWA